MNRRDPRIVSLAEFVEANLADAQLSARQVACHVCLSESRVRQLLQEHIHTSLSQYIRERRLSRARELLHSSFLSVKEVMAKVGLSDPSHFSKNYKRHFKITPRLDRSPLLRFSIDGRLSGWPRN
jgi:transcriptional regulator GlxA family with amidase domain